MDARFRDVRSAGARCLPGLVVFALGCSSPFFETPGEAQDQSLSTEKTAQGLKEAAQEEARQYDIHYGPVGLQVGGTLRLGYTDNVFYSDTDRRSDYLINPEVDLGAFMQVSELNTLKLSLKLGYEYYLNNTVLNSDAPLVNPGSEIAFNLFVGDFHIRMHEQFSYQESLFFNGFAGDNQTFYNFNNVGTFVRLDNKTGFDVTWSLDKAVFTAGYDHEIFDSSTSSFEYLDRESEWFTASGGYFLGDHLQAGAEGRASLHHYDQQTILTDNWRAGIGPFVEATLPQKVTLRAGAGFDAAEYEMISRGSDRNTYYAYARLRQETRLFRHWLEAGRELLLGENANNMQTIYVRYSISSPLIAHVDLRAHIDVNFAQEFGGPSGFDERFTYYTTGFDVAYQFAKHWRSELGYEFRLKDSDVPLRDFRRNQVNVSMAWTY
jgi:hypothetical protein